MGNDIFCFQLPGKSNRIYCIANGIRSADMMDISEVKEFGGDPWGPR